MTLLTQLQKWRELRSKATQGEWLLFHNMATYPEGLTTLQGAKYSFDAGDPCTYSAVYSGDDVICDNADFYPHATSDDDCAFIAQTPSILAALEQSVALCLEMRDVLLKANSRSIDMGDHYSVPLDDYEPSVFDALTHANELLGEE